MMEEIRLGTIGSGMIAHAIADNVLRTPGIRITTVYSRTRETGEAMAKQYGAAHVYTELEAFFREEDMDFVYIASPNILHYPQAKMALLAGKNVILEKPFTPRLEEAKELIALAKERGLYLIDAVPTAFLPNLEIIRAQLPRLGRIRMTMGNFSQYSSRYDKFRAGQLTNVFNPEFAGGCLMDINFYNLYLNVTLFGKPQEAVYFPNMAPGQVDTSGILVLRYPDFVCQCAGAKDTWGVNFFQVEGEDGFLYATCGPTGLESVRVVTKDSDETFSNQPVPEARWAYEVETITKRVLSGDRAYFEKGLETMLIVIEQMEKCRQEIGLRFPGDQ